MLLPRKWDTIAGNWAHIIGWLYHPATRIMCTFYGDVLVRYVINGPGNGFPFITYRAAR